ncbi:MAG: 8-amino-7-oxononanoate synthase [Gammaproteobacteria bacterium]|nr:8-amino-7-oxononanoate synthase [Gammaproteobacteria bacterium]
MNALQAQLREELAQLAAAGLYRRRHAVDGSHGTLLTVDGRPCVNFCSNDYLGLAADPRLAQAAAEALSRCGVGSGAAALVSGYNQEHAGLEQALAEFVGRPRALLFSSGWAANLGVLRALLTRADDLVADELNHASLIDGGRLSGARYRRVGHCDLPAFQRALAAARERKLPASARQPRAFVVTDTVFSMDGDLADLPALARLARRYGAALMVDDAHGFGVLGANGRGAPEHFSGEGGIAADDVDVYIATLGKSLGVAGAFVAGSQELIDYLVQRARTWVFSTAMPPALAAAARAALGIVNNEPERRRRLFANIARFRAGAEQLGIAIGSPHATRGAAVGWEAITPIQPLVIGGAARTLALARHLFEAGFWVAAIRPPTVPPNTARLRITLSAAHAPAQIDALLEALAEGCRRCGVNAGGLAAPAA